jgi:Response regulator containing a CheY-like receiver domain and an HTH DNA-binding domain
VRPIRIVLGKIPRLLRDIVVEVIGSESDMRIVGEAESHTRVDDLLRSAQADVFVIDDSAESEAGGRERLVREHRRLRVLVLSDRGKAAECHWIEPHTALCLDVSPDQLVSFIRMSFDGGAIR